MNDTLPKVLLIEDNEDDVFLLQRALKAAQLDVDLTVLDDGEKALEFFEQAARATPTPTMPDLVLLDLKLPYVHGFEVLEFIRQQPQLKDLDVIVLTSSGEIRDQEKATVLRAHGYHVKPPTADLIATVSKFLAANANK
jgi:CheY-like chemotaxis protein